MTTNPQLGKYFYHKDDLYKYLPSSNKDFMAICPDCNVISIKNLNQIHTYGFTCSICSDKISYPEKILAQILHKTGLDFETQVTNKRFKWCKKYKYDFYIPSLNMIIETHGLQHYKDTIWGNVKDISKNDENKEFLARKNGVEKYIQLDCRYSDIDYIKNSCYNSELNNFIDFATMDWGECDMAANNSIMLNIINDYNNNISISELSKKYKLCENTIREYLKKGNCHGLCKYLKNKVPLLVYKDDKLIFEVESISKLKRIAKEELGVKMSDGGIYEASISGKLYKGYIVKRKER